MSQLEQSDQRLQSAEQLVRQAAASAETNRPSDSVPAISGSFANLPIRFGRYEVESLLGRGAMGAVYLARDTHLDRKVALKIPKVSASGSKRLLLRLRTEAKAAAQLDHQGLCKVYEWGEVEGQCFIAMQYLQGTTLKTQLEESGKSISEAVSLILNLADSLIEAHELGIVHRDLKPENIMINRKGIPVIMDFGLAKFSTITRNATSTQAGTILGSPAYMSPEQANGSIDEVDHRSDIYSLGVILFEMLTGEWPFTGTSMQILGQKSVLDAEAPISINPTLPSELSGICHKMIARTREERYQSLAEVIADLKALKLRLPDSDAGDVNSNGQHANLHSLNPILADFNPFGSPEHESPPGIAKTKWKPTAGSQADGTSASGARTLPQPLINWRGHWRKIVQWALLSGMAIFLVAMGVVLLFPTRHGILRIEIEDPKVAVRFDGDAISIENAGKPIRVTPTEKHTLDILVDGTAVESPLKELTLKNGEHRLLTVKLIEGNVVIEDSNGASHQFLTPAAPKVSLKPVKTPGQKSEVKKPEDHKPVAKTSNSNKADGKAADETQKIVQKVPVPLLDRQAVTNGIGDWKIEGNDLVQTQIVPNNMTLVFGSPDWSDYDLTFDVQTKSGSHGFKTLFHHTDVNTYYEFATGNYGNQFHDVSCWEQGQWRRGEGMIKPGTISTDRWYSVKLKVRGAKVSCLLDGIEEFTINDPAFVRGRCGVALFDTSARFRTFLVTRPDDEESVLWKGLPELPSPAQK